MIDDGTPEVVSCRSPEAGVVDELVEVCGIAQMSRIGGPGSRRQFLSPLPRIVSNLRLQKNAGLTFSIED